MKVTVLMMDHVLDLQMLVSDTVVDGVPTYEPSAMSQAHCVCESVLSLLICSNAPL